MFVETYDIMKRFVLGVTTDVVAGSLGTLVITGITPDMAGVYHCNAENAIGDRASLDVVVVVRFPPVIVRFSEAAVMSDVSSSLHCEVNAYPLAVVYWATPTGTIINENR